MENNGRVRQFQERPAAEGAWINGGFFVLEPSGLDYIEGDATPWEFDPMKRSGGGRRTDGLQA